METSCCLFCIYILFLIMEKSLDFCNKCREGFHFYCEEHRNLSVHKLLNRITLLETKIKGCAEPLGNLLQTSLTLSDSNMIEHEPTSTDSENSSDSKGQLPTNISDWSNLDSQFLCKVFDYFSFEELKIISLVCHNWYEEIAFLWRDTLKLDFQYFHNDTSSFQSNIRILKNSKRIYSNLKIKDNKFFKETEAIFKAIPLRKNFKCKYVKSLELDEHSMLQIEDIFNWMGESLEELIISRIRLDLEYRNTTSKTDDHYFKVFSNLKIFRVISVGPVPDKLQNLYKYFGNVTDLSLNDFSKEIMQCFPKIKRLNLAHRSKEFNIDFDVLKSMKDFQDLFIDYDIFNLSVAHATLFQSIWNVNMKNLKALRGNIFSMEYLTDLNSFDFTPRLSLTTMDINGTNNSYLNRKDYCSLVSKLLQCLPNLENLYLSSFDGDISLIFDQLSNLDNLKTLKIFNVRRSIYAGSEKSREYCLPALEHLEIRNNGTQDYTLELPKLKKIIMENDSLSAQSLWSIFLTSKNLEFMEIEWLTNFKTMDPYISQLLRLPKLKMLSLIISRDEHIFQAPEYFLRYTHFIKCVKLRYGFIPHNIDEKEFDSKLKDLSNLADKTLTLSEQRTKKEYLFIKNGNSIKFRVNNVTF